MKTPNIGILTGISYVLLKKLKLEDVLPLPYS